MSSKNVFAPVTSQQYDPACALCACTQRQNRLSSATKENVTEDNYFLRISLLNSCVT